MEVWRVDGDLAAKKPDSFGIRAPERKLGSSVWVWCILSIDGRGETRDACASAVGCVMY